ncbi:Exocyst complex component 1 [Cichlidogyrus casuarinus]|uniref:Exocyst complex component 1 n=1 Tax=Cichlidogyrus casuarinus TaxID=1844966 RepID=A0ABD2QCT5_9PLAT
MKQQEKQDYKKKFICEYNQIKKFDLKQSHPYDFDIHTDSKVWHFTITTWELKLKFITTLCCVIEFQFPGTIASMKYSVGCHQLIFNINKDKCELNSDSKGFKEVEKLEADGEKLSVSHNTLNPREEADINKFIEDEGIESILNATSFMEHLEKILSDVEGTNVKSIMDSERQVENLMNGLDSAIAQLDKMQQKVERYDGYLSSLEESMANLKDRDQILKMTSANRMKMLEVLEHLINRLTIHPQVKNLIESDCKIITNQDLDNYLLAAQEFERIAKIPELDGEKHFTAVQNQMRQIEKLQSKFCEKIKSRFMGSLQIMSDNVLKTLQTNTTVPTPANSDFSGTIDYPVCLKQTEQLIRTHQPELIAVAPLIAPWMQNNDRNAYDHLKTEYQSLMGPVFRRIVGTIFDTAIEQLNYLIGSRKGYQNAKIDPNLFETGLHFTIPPQKHVKAFKAVSRILPKILCPSPSILF